MSRPTDQPTNRASPQHLLHMSGECLCGSFAEPGELDEIRALELEAAAAGVPCKWGVRPPGRRQHALRDSAGRLSPLCSQCELKFEGAGAR